MESRGDRQARNLRLPSGRSLEVVRLEADAEPATGPADRLLHVCPTCESELVQPHDWVPAGAERWTVTLYCPECGHDETSVFAQETVDRFDDELEAGAHEVARDLAVLARSNFEEEIERFTAALAADAILPEDFYA